MIPYGIEKTFKGDFNTIVEKTKSELAKEGFGILTDINVRDTLRKKLDVEYQNYIILGACHPQSAYQVLQKEKEVGLLLPCNVIVYATDNGLVHVAAIKPTSAMQMVKNNEIRPIAEEIEKKLQRVINNLEG